MELWEPLLKKMKRFVLYSLQKKLNSIKAAIEEFVNKQLLATQKFLKESDPTLTNTAGMLPLW